jgi:hypothetical protein
MRYAEPACLARVRIAFPSAAVWLLKGRRRSTRGRQEVDRGGTGTVCAGGVSGVSNAK